MGIRTRIAALRRAAASPGVGCTRESCSEAGAVIVRVRIDGRDGWHWWVGEQVAVYRRGGHTPLRNLSRCRPVLPCPEQRRCHWKTRNLGVLARMPFLQYIVYVFTPRYPLSCLPHTHSRAITFVSFISFVRESILWSFIWAVSAILEVNGCHVHEFDGKVLRKPKKKWVGCT